MGTDKYKKDWYCVCGGLQDIRRTGTGCVEDHAEDLVCSCLQSVQRTITRSVVDC